MFSTKRWIAFATGSLLLALAGLTAAPGVAEAATSPKWAVFNSAGTLVRGHGVVSSSRLSAGSYEVVFASNMAKCAYVATAGDTGAGAVAGSIEATVATRAGNENALFIQTFEQSTGALADEPVHVQTYCGAKRIFGVIATDGTKARGGAVTSSTHLAAGSYEVVFNRKVNKCVFGATLGTTGAGAISAPGEITVAGRAGNLNAVFVRVVDRAGNSLDSSFHLGVECGTAHVDSVVESTGVIARGASVVSAAKLGGTNAGTYAVIFNRNVAICSYSATVGVSTNGGAISTPVTITTATRAGNVDGVFIFIHKTDGSTIDAPFHLIVEC